MPYLAEALLFLAPFALYALWLRLNPGRAVAGHLVAVALVGVLIAIGAAVWYGLSQGMSPGGTYVPAHITADGIEPGHARPGPAPTSSPVLSPAR